MVKTLEIVKCDQLREGKAVKVGGVIIIGTKK